MESFLILGEIERFWLKLKRTGHFGDDFSMNQGSFLLKSITPFYMWIYGHVYDLYRMASQKLGEGQSSPISRIESVHDT